MHGCISSDNAIIVTTQILIWFPRGNLHNASLKENNVHVYSHNFNNKSSENIEADIKY